ncbi:conserved hypothetical protein [Uncinocarpus reesii 1704]|uniref:Very long-chain fatty acid transport protein n=1 Tax=Uncinocarpus reesii (strain UAMH 1704) TaxID=336963 RepID=C4JR94_UNCRE|nr:uncharacterized protein UREG_03576 [Uncinocarpus reesii 1704]EEP78730.1 conserved hypothetical protein [Uncinocarpus reesii 1704]
MALTTAALVAGGASVAAYLNAKYHIHRDLSTITKTKSAERATARAAANGTLSAWNFFAEQVKKQPNATCIWTREAEFTFQEAHDMACQYGHYLLSLGVKRGDLVAVYLQNCSEFPILWLGLWAIGCSPALINYNLAGPALMHCLKVSSAEILIVDSDPDCAGRVEEQRAAIEGELNMKPLLLDENLKSYIATFPSAVPDESFRKGIEGGSPACLFYTSGTTGLPKASAFTTSRMYYSILTSDLFESSRGSRDRWYNCMPLYHGTGGVRLQVCLCRGDSVAIGKKFSTRNFWRDVIDSESTHFIYVGETARYLLSAPPSPLDRQHKVRGMYGNGLRPDVWERFRERFGVPSICEFFNSTEGMFGLLNINHGPYSAACVGHHGLILRKLFHNTYIPVAIDSVTGDILRDPATGFATRMSYEEGGEMIVAVANESAFQGYWKNPEATSKKFVRDIFEKGDLYYRTGDALRRTADGHWHFLDRLGDTFRWKSENVSTAEVAVVLGEFPGVLEANVYGVLVPNYEGRAGCAALQLDPSVRERFDWAGLVRHAREKLPRYAVPVFIRVVEASDHIHNNKQNKVPLRDEGVDPAKKGTKVKNGGADRVLWMKAEEDTYNARREMYTQNKHTTLRGITTLSNYKPMDRCGHCSASSHWGPLGSKAADSSTMRARPEFLAHQRLPSSSCSRTPQCMRMRTGRGSWFWTAKTKSLSTMASQPRTASMLATRAKRRKQRCSRVMASWLMRCRDGFAVSRVSSLRVARRLRASSVWSSMRSAAGRAQKSDLEAKMVPSCSQGRVSLKMLPTPCSSSKTKMMFSAMELPRSRSEVICGRAMPRAVVMTECASTGSQLTGVMLSRARRKGPMARL